MLDQSFSTDNFRIIYDIENRKGNYLEEKGLFDNEQDYFQESRRITREIIEINAKIREEKKILPSEETREEKDYKKLNELLERKRELKGDKEKEVDRILALISDKINYREFKFEIKKGQVKFGKQLYNVSNTIESFLVSKQLQRNVFKTFGVKQQNRNLIIHQIRLLLKDNFPKIVLRTDISNFYESIPHEELLKKISNNNLLSYYSKKIIREILRKYWDFLISDGLKTSNDKKVGIPRGVGICAYLAELYLKDFDKRIKALPQVSYYARYVDDIIIVFTPTYSNNKTATSSYKNKVKRLIESLCLEMNIEKTKTYDLRKKGKERKTTRLYKITFLGYKFITDYRKKKNKDKCYPGKLTVRMSDDKLSRYKKKIDLTFDDFLINISKYAGKERATNRQLIQRLKILTKNYRLSSRKNNVLIGVYFSNKFLSEELIDLKELDKYMQDKIEDSRSVISSETMEQLNDFSFEQGFLKVQTTSFNFNSQAKRGAVNIEKVTKIWANL